MRQASFITNFFPEGAEFGVDYGAFPFPSIDGQDGALIAGEFAVVFDDRPEVREFIRIFTDTEAQCTGGSFEGVSRISPNVNKRIKPTIAASSKSVPASCQPECCISRANVTICSAVSSIAKFSFAPAAASSKAKPKVAASIDLF